MAAFQRRQAAARPRLVLVAGAAVAALSLGNGIYGFVSGSGRRSANALNVADPARLPRGLRRVAVAVAAGREVDAKARLMDLLNDEAVAREVLRPEGKPTKGRVDEAIISLERMNMETEPVYSEKLDGTWTVKYSGSYAPGLLSSPTRELALFLYGGGFSLGNALSSFAAGPWGGGAVVGGKTVKISGDGRIVKALLDLELAGFKQKLSYIAELMPLSGMRMSEEVLNVRLPEPLRDQILPFSLRRSILITYLDEDIMIVRDESGVPEVLERELVPVVPAVVTFSRSNTIATSISDVQPPNATAFGVANAAATGAANATTSKKSTTSKK
mmetsp:Transcript_33254/g.95689  ORF Transcript_33254/g.95689 Transcript_33254/m.95689 type:complete len:329 (-) Transcript_33254:97-1083(-)